jgi:hypothetical protein
VTAFTGSVILCPIMRGTSLCRVPFVPCTAVPSELADFEMAAKEELGFD